MNSAKKTSSGKTRSRIPGGSPISAILLVLRFLPTCRGTQIAWHPNLEWNTKVNWDDEIVPRNGTHVVFPVELRLSVGLPTRNAALDLAGVELPRDGVIALPESGFLQISEMKPTTKSARWSREGPLLWADPDNWYSVRSSSAVPHLERIPCQGDVVTLPRADSTFSIQLPRAAGTMVKSIRVTNDGELPPWEWRERREQMEFAHGPRTVEYTKLQSCVECPCQQEAAGREILDEVCKTKGAICPQLECEYPVEVEGSCCSYCGGRVVLPAQTSLSLAKNVAKMALGNYGNTLAYHVRRKWDKTAEILVAGTKAYSQIDTMSAIEALKLTFEEQGINLVASELTGGEMRGSRTAAFLGPFFGTLLFVIVAVLVVMPYYGYPLPQIIGESWSGLRTLVVTTRATSTQPILPREKPFGFAKFENAPEAEVELAGPSGSVPVVEGIEEDEDEDEVEEEGGGRFANPLYRSGRRGGPEAQTFSSLKRIQNEEADEEIDLGIEP